MKICSVSECEREAIARGWCSAHHKRWLKHGDIKPDMPIKEQIRYKGEKVCMVDNCNMAIAAKGYCNNHYRSFKIYGNPFKGIRAYEYTLRGTTCSIIDCANKAKARQLCDKHLTRYYRHGNVEGKRRGIEIEKVHM